MYKAILEKEKKCNDVLGEYTRYIYDVDGIKVAFDQYMSGRLYFMSIYENEKLRNAKIELFMDCGESVDIYYPQNIEIYPHFRFDYTHADKYIEALQYAKEVTQTIMDIFNKNSKHYKFYEEMKG